MKHSVYAPALGHTKRRYDTVLAVKPTLLRRLFRSIRCMHSRHTGLSKTKSPRCSSQSRLNSSVYWVLFGPARLSAGLRIIWATSSPRHAVAARQPNTQTNSDSSRDESDRPPNTKVRLRSGHAGRGSWIRVLAGSH